MSSEQGKPTSKWLKSGRVSFEGSGQVDVENGIIHDVIMCQVGEAKGHGVHLEQEFIEAGIKYATKHHNKLGMKARFGHPSMSNETLGTEMGRFKNFKVVDDKMVADLHLFKSANLSPNNPGMRDWMIGMADEDPNAIMCSIVFVVGSHYQRNKDGEKFEIEWVPKGWNGEWESKDKKNKFDPDKKIYVSLKQLLFCDIVDQGAATDKLFSADFNKDKFGVIATEFLNEYPQVDQFIQENPEKLVSFLQDRFQFAESEKKNIFQKFLESFKDAFSSQKESGDQKKQANTIHDKDMNFERSLEILDRETPSAEELAEVKTEIEQFTGETEKFSKEELDQSVKTAKQEQQKELDQANEKIQELQGIVESLKNDSEKPEKPKKKGQEELETATEDEIPYSVKIANQDLGD